MIRLLIKLYIYIVILDAILSYFPQLQAQQWVQYIRKIAGYSLNPVRKYLPDDMPFDVSPIIVIVVLNLLMVLW